MSKRTLEMLPNLELVLSRRPRVVLLIEDEPDYRAAVDKILRSPESRQTIGDIDIEHAASVAEAEAALARRRFDLLIVDWHLGPDSGLDLLVRARANGLITSAIMLTTDERLDLALDTAADDYVRKSDMRRQLRPRVNARLRRDAPRFVLDYGPLHINFTDNLIRYAPPGRSPLDGAARRLKQIEITLLGYLVLQEARATAPGANNRSDVVTMEELLEHVYDCRRVPWKDGIERIFVPDSNAVEKSISTLRTALKAMGAPDMVKRVPASLELADARRLPLSEEDQDRARKLTIGYRFAAEAPLGQIVTVHQ